MMIRNVNNRQLIFKVSHAKKTKKNETSRFFCVSY